MEGGEDGEGREEHGCWGKEEEVVAVRRGRQGMLALDVVLMRAVRDRDEGPDGVGTRHSSATYFDRFFPRRSVHASFHSTARSILICRPVRHITHTTHTSSHLRVEVTHCTIALQYVMVHQRVEIDIH